MAATRRQFLQASASAAAALSLDPAAFAQEPTRPNVLLLVIDTLRADHVSAYGGRAQTRTSTSSPARGSASPASIRKPWRPCPRGDPS
jgi:hypothetical protein